MSSNSEHTILLRSEHGGLHFTIETDGPDVGGYFLWTKRDDGIDIDEFFDDTVERCKAQALKNFGVPLESWHA
jgi:type V secretory pathway adhesin AidA